MTTRVAAVASSMLAPVLAAPARPANVLASFPVATYLDTAGGVVAIVTPDAVRLPNAVLVKPADYAAIQPGRRGRAEVPTLVGDGTVRVGAVEIGVVRWWNPVPRLGPVGPVALGEALKRLGDLLPAWPDRRDPALSRLTAGRARLVDALAGRVAPGEAVSHLVGLGSGLTPAGDDLLAGTLAGLVVLGSAVDAAADPSMGPTLPSRDPAALADEIAREATDRAGSTTRLAADLTRLAAGGALAEPAAAVCRALSGTGPLESAVARLLRIGHTSGRDLAEGLLVGGQAVTGGYGG